VSDNTVVYRPDANQRLCEQKPLLGNNRDNRRTVFSVVRAAAVSGQRLGKHVPMEMDTNATIEEQCFLCGPCQDDITRPFGVICSVVSSMSQRATV
jgi:hypothetical protein